MTKTTGSRRARVGNNATEVSGYLFAAPALLGFAVLVGYPLVMVVYYSFSDFNPLTNNISFIGLENYGRMLTDPTMPSVALATTAFTTALVVTNLSVALGLALLLNVKLRGISFFRTAFFSPVVVSLVAWTLVWGALLQDDGAINGVLSAVGVDGPNWLREPVSAMVAVVLIQLFKGVGINMVLFLAALQAVPNQTIEAAMIDGANAWQRFWRIIFFVISPTVLLASVLVVAGSLQVFAQIQILTAGGPSNATNVLGYYIYRQGFQFFDLGYASALAVVLFVIIAGLTAAQWAIKSRWLKHD